jgi:hypothetical protein
VKKEGGCWYTAEQREYVPERPQKKAVVNNAYLSKHAPIVRERMKMAGVSLAAILNTIFADAIISKTVPLATPATSEDIHQLSDRIERLEEAIRVLTKQLQHPAVDMERIKSRTAPDLPEAVWFESGGDAQLLQAGSAPFARVRSQAIRESCHAVAKTESQPAFVGQFR